MAVNGVARVTFGVESVSECARFYEDFGITNTRLTDDAADFSVPDGSEVRIRRCDDDTLPASYSTGSCAREVIWGVDSEEDLDRLGHDLCRDRNLTQDAEGVLHFPDDQGFPIGLMQRVRKKPEPQPELVNSPSRPARRNQLRVWYDRAVPTSIQHVVFAVPDVACNLRFYCDRLGFRITDISRGRGIFARCNGRNDHHNLFLQASDSMQWRHISFDVQNIDELMAGANHMQRRGWNSDLGIGRHRVSSAIFYYILSPCGGEVEYSADTDFADDDWQPGIWAPEFGIFHWVGALPPSLREQPAPAEDVILLNRPAKPADLQGVS